MDKLTLEVARRDLQKAYISLDTANTLQEKGDGRQKNNIRDQLPTLNENLKIASSVYQTMLLEELLRVLPQSIKSSGKD